MSETSGIQVIGAGAGRTGTASLKRALETLGFAPCYHMTEVINNSHSSGVEKALTTDKREWLTLLRGYKAAVDFPASAAYTDLIELYPDAKVVLSVRDPTSWAKSVQETIWSPYSGQRSWVRALWRPSFALMGRAFRRRFFKGGDYGAVILDDPDRLAEAFMEWNEEVKRTVPSEKLLVFQAKDGWDPLCKFLGVPEPSEPFPHVNDANEFKERMMLTWRGCLAMDIAVLAAAVAVGIGIASMRVSK
mmetsp:Transcript_11577/g.32831  ORF Transcript_11577/g.32831 Transcript_11577/m.32831 type:complete len:247 (+) Transcript_11577:230-970(+)|eukprot:CAMPEP_0117647758 /NCGR_PEP_ID=MMETSP0804-20121206/15_1 /TAXON_ID=1074897 /ORGANISM="Tetraselmis astigmatica, Strain CCMP880" /LENGTH=246 /DNA_ID=CAMNT_0005453261 /DNA_START=206 /DNA_END=946 /DNA_ORIENTATION=+